MANRPSGRGRNVSNLSGSVSRRGSGLGGGPVGGGRTSGSFRGSGSSGGGGNRSSGGGGCGGCLGFLILLAIVIFGGGGGILSLFDDDGGSTGPSQNPGNSYNPNSGNQTVQYAPAAATASFNIPENTAQLDTSVASGSREKYTKIKGDGKDTTTIMIYMCGTDLESENGMATNDLQEIINANTSDNINVLLYTGGCKKWKNNVVDSKVNQIYQIKGGKMLRLVKDDGKKPMTDPATLASFIKWGKKNYPANRMDLILWDHGGGSVSGFGYDEKFDSPKSMTLAGIKSALESANVKFDFVGFDACLMATAENALMLNEFADYLIASEETEPGVGWYYTPWLKAYSKNPSMPTVEIGKNIVDSFVDECDRSCKGQKTTLSVIDLAEFYNTVPDELYAFAQSTTELIKGDDYKRIATARSGAREFATSSKIDQVDLVDFCRRVGTKEAKSLAKALLSAVKYNRYSKKMTNSYGVSIFFPNKKLKYVKSAEKTYNQIGVGDDYTQCIKAFAAYEESGQVVSSGANHGSTGTPWGSLLGDQETSGGNSWGSIGSQGSFVGSSSSGSNSQAGVTADIAIQLLQALFSEGPDRSIAADMDDFDVEEAAGFILNNSLDANALIWTENDEGQPVIALSEDQWGTVKELGISMFYDDGQGYIDLGFDSIYEYDEEGNLAGPGEITWLAVNDQIVSYYQTGYVVEDDIEVYSGYIPALVDKQRVKLLVTITCDDDTTVEEITGAVIDYRKDETDTIAKEFALEEGQKIDFVADYYSYQGEYLDSYMIGKALTVPADGLRLSDMHVDGKVRITYKFTDTLGQEYWSAVMPY